MAKPGTAPRLALLSLLTIGGCGGDEPAGPDATAAPGTPAFLDRATELGLDFVHFNGMTGALLYPEMMGSGAALLDYDGDGDLDLYLVQGARLGAGTPLVPARHPEPLTDRLYRNDLSPDGGWRFVDVTDRAGALPSGYGMGVAVGDADGDGWPDLYVTNFGSNVLLLNRRDGSFEDRTEWSGTDDPGWSVPALFVDFDGDRHQDLYVGNYLEYSVAADRACFGTTGARDYCGPTAYPGGLDRIFRNRGDARFEDVTNALGADRRGRALGAIDIDLDGRPGLYVANDGEPNFLWVYRDRRFEETALVAGAALDLEGRPQASMGVDAADFDRDGDEDLLLTHLTGEAATLYRAEAGSRFTDVSRATGVTAATLAATGFGVAWLDYDADGWPDLLTVNGAVRQLEEQVRLGDRYPLKQRKQLLRNRGDGSFEDVTEASGEAFTSASVGRGAAAGDLDGDGDLDVLVSNNNGPAELLIDPSPGVAAWVGAIVPAGARIVVSRPGLSLTARSRTAGSYGSARDPRVALALGEWRGAVEVEVHGFGVVRRYRSVPSNRYLVARR